MTFMTVEDFEKFEKQLLMDVLLGRGSVLADGRSIPNLRLIRDSQEAENPEEAA